MTLPKNIRIPNNARRYRVAVDVPCLKENPCPGRWEDGLGWTSGPPCKGCLNDGYRTVVTDVEIKPIPPLAGQIRRGLWEEPLS